MYYNVGEREKFGKRNSFLGDNADFYNFQEAINTKNFERMNKVLLAKSLHNNSIIKPYGELYGMGVQKRVYYGPGRYLRFYDIKENGEFWPGEKSMEFFQNFDLFVPVVAIVEGFEAAITYCCEFVSKLTPEDWNGVKEDNFAEGFVMRPMNFDIQNPSGSRFTIKSKHPKFKDQEKSKTKKSYAPMEGSLRDLVDAAKTYVNENRLFDLISKMGPLTERSQIGPYMKAFSKDWQDEFKDDYAEELAMASMEYEKSDVKNVFKIAGKNAINLIKNYIEDQEKVAKAKLLNT